MKGHRDASSVFNNSAAQLPKSCTIKPWSFVTLLLCTWSLLDSLSINTCLFGCIQMLILLLLYLQPESTISALAAAWYVVIASRSSPATLIHYLVVGPAVQVTLYQVAPSVQQRLVRRPELCCRLTYSVLPRTVFI